MRKKAGTAKKELGGFKSKIQTTKYFSQTHKSERTKRKP